MGPLPAPRLEIESSGPPGDLQRRQSIARAQFLPYVAGAKSFQYVAPSPVKPARSPAAASV
jgi:hypothetical protein